MSIGRLCLAEQNSSISISITQPPTGAHRHIVTHIYIHRRAQRLPRTVAAYSYANGESISNGRQSPCPPGPARRACARPVAIHPFASTHQSCPGACQIQEGHGPETGRQQGQGSTQELWDERALAAAAPSDGTHGNGGFFGNALSAPAAAAALPARLLRRAEPPGVVVLVDGLVRHVQGRRRQPRALRLHLLPLHRRLEGEGLRPQVQEHGAQRVELHPLGAGQGLVRGRRLLGQGRHGGEQRRRRLGVQRQGHRQAVLPRRQEPRRVHTEQGAPQARQEQVRRRLALRPTLRRVPAQHRLPAAVPHLRRRARRQPAAAVQRPAAVDAPEHGLPAFQLHLRDILQHRRLRRRPIGVPGGEEARAAGHDGVGRAVAHRHDHRALLPAAGPVLVLHPPGHPGVRLRPRHRGRRPRLPPQRGRAQERGRAQGARHRHLGHGVSSGVGDPGAAGQDVQGAAVLELVPPQHRARDHTCGHRQRLPGSVHREGDQCLHRLIRCLRRRVGGGRRRLRDEALLRRRRLTTVACVDGRPWQRRNVQSVNCSENSYSSWPLIGR